MKFDPKIHHRRSIRLKGYDYSQSGAYFVTMVAWQREMLFGAVVDEEMVLNDNGQIVRDAWFDLPNHYPHVELGEFIVMPNHVHAIIVLIDDDGRGGSQTRPYHHGTAKRHGLSEIVRAFKSFSSRRINTLRHTDGIPVWQRNYHEHIIRNEYEMDRITRYIESNPSRWVDDEENPNHLVL